jgi:hypothetical protein
MTHERDQLDQRIEQDRKSLGAASRAGLWSLERVRRTVAPDNPTDIATNIAADIAASLRHRHRGAIIMSTINRLKSRPRLVSILGVCALAAALLVIPIRYQRTVGHRVDLTVSGAALDRVGLERLAAEVGQVTRAQTLEVREAAGGGAVLGIGLGAVSEERAERVAGALVERLRERAFTAEARVSPITETVSGNVYAMVRDRIIVIDVDTEGKTEEEVEDEIRAQLLDEGIADPSVKYHSDPEKTVLRVEGEHEGKAFKLVQKQVGDERDSNVRMEIGGLDTSRDEGMTDEELEAKIRSQLEARGLSGDVKVHGDDVRVRVYKHAPCEGEGCEDHAENDADDAE